MNCASAPGRTVTLARIKCQAQRSGWREWPESPEVQRGSWLTAPMMNEAPAGHTGLSMNAPAYHVTRKTLEEFIDLNDELEKHLKNINLAKLSQWERFAVEQTLQRIEDKKAGRQEADYGRGS